MEENPEKAVIDAIDQLVNESLAHGPTDDYERPWTEYCELCYNEWHGQPNTLSDCPGAWATEDDKAAFKAKRSQRTRPLSIDHPGALWTLPDRSVAIPAAIPAEPVLYYHGEVDSVDDLPDDLGPSDAGVWFLTGDHTAHVWEGTLYRTLRVAVSGTPIQPAFNLTGEYIDALVSVGPDAIHALTQWLVSYVQEMVDALSPVPLIGDLLQQLINTIIPQPTGTILTGLLSSCETETFDQPHAYTRADMEALRGGFSSLPRLNARDTS